MNHGMTSRNATRVFQKDESGVILISKRNKTVSLVFLDNNMYNAMKCTTFERQIECSALPRLPSTLFSCSPTS